MPARDPWLAVARALADRHVGVARLDLLGSSATHAVLLVRAGTTRLVLKVAAADTRPGLDLARSAAAQELARRAGVPAGTVVAAGVDAEVPAVQYLLQEEVQGSEWRTVRPQLRPAELARAYADIAGAVLALQSVTIPSFGALDDPAPRGLLDALHTRVDLRIPEGARRQQAHDVLHDHADLFRAPDRPTLTHDDLHHANLLFRRDKSGWVLAGILDWDKAWAGSAEADVARMAFWDGMTDPVFWSVYREGVPERDGWARRAEVYQLLWCLEYDVDTARHRQDTAALVARLT
ncbi:phosphotransferase family protein [Cellulomonas sp. Root485]|uniref:phosphotransferase family protein n=1 Tax=Cellulomonas sp. Root485 TaxID=1736546 RepID=UPI00138ECAB7|nr:phosphotransferase [Cellulomonas sp. Root485]